MTIGDFELTARLHLAAHELVENVMKYGSSPDIGFELAVEREHDESVVSLSTKNTAQPEQIRQVSQRVSELRSARDPVAYYDQLIRGTAPVVGQSGLGLARIRAEAGLDVDCSVDGPEVSIVVRTMAKGRR